MSETGFSFTPPRLSVLLESAKRFPLAVLAALAFAVLILLATFMTTLRDGDVLAFYLPAAFLALLGAGLVAEAKRWPRFKLGVAPASLAVLLLASSFGPWGAEALSLSSQHARLEHTLTELGVLKDGHLAEKADLSATSWQTRRTLSSQLDYIYEHPKHLPPYLDALKSEDNRTYPPSLSEELMRRWNMVYIGKWEQRADNDQPIRHYNFYSASTFSGQDKALTIEGYDWLMTFSTYRNQAANTSASPILSAVIRDETLVLSIAKQGEVVLDPLSLLPESPDQPRPVVNREPIVTDLKIGQARVHLVLENINLDAKEDTTANVAPPKVWTLTRVSGYALVDLP